MASIPPVVRALSSSGSLGSPRAGRLTLPLLQDEQRVAEEEEEGEEEEERDNADAEAGGGGDDDEDDDGDAASDAPSFSPELGPPTIGRELRR